MKYKGFYIDIIPDNHLVRTDSSGNEVICRGFSFSVFTDEARTEKFDEFTAAVGYGLSTHHYMKEKGLVQVTDTGAIEEVVRAVCAENAAQFAEFKAGKVALKGFLVGMTMRKSGGKANPGLVNQILDKLAKE